MTRQIVVIGIVGFSFNLVACSSDAIPTTEVGTQRAALSGDDDAFAVTDGVTIEAEKGGNPQDDDWFIAAARTQLGADVQHRIRRSHVPPGNVPVQVNKGDPQCGQRTKSGAVIGEPDADVPPRLSGPSETNVPYWKRTTGGSHEALAH